MRYQDWDILLYPKGCDVPFKEFKTTCYAVQEDGRGGVASGNAMSSPFMMSPTPLLTCFVPGAMPGSPFSISLHSWTPPMHVAMSGLGERAMWQIKVTVDGVMVATQLCPHNCAWPQAISGTAIDHNGNPTLRDLSWPTFHKSATMHRDWDAADPTGRIKVELAAGFKEQLDGKMVFTNLSTIVCFSFFPAPIVHLERAGIAWPNPKMFEKPLHTDAQLALNGANLAQGLNSAVHRRTYSNGSATASSPMGGLPMPPPPTPALGHFDLPTLQGSNTQCLRDVGSNGLVFPDTINGHELQNAFSAMAMPSLHESPRGQRAQLEIRLPSDQLQKLILAMSPSKQGEANSTDSTQMPPPPLPLHALAAKAGENDQTGNDDIKGVEVNIAAGMDITLPNASRGSSDVSMHTGCTFFPSCVAEDDSSLVVHNNPTCPSANIKGRKEGSSPLKPRDFLSTILGAQDNGMVSPVTDDAKSTMSSDSPGETPGRKRTRSALKALNIHDGSPEKKDGSARKPLRKMSRASSGVSKKSKDVNVAGASTKTSMVDDEDKENQMVVDF